MKISDIKIEGFHLDRNLVSKTKLYSFIKDDNEDDYIDITEDCAEHNIIIGEIYHGCERVYVTAFNMSVFSIEDITEILSAKYDEIIDSESN